MTREATGRPGPGARDDPATLGRRLRERDVTAAPAALNLLEQRSDPDRTGELLGEVGPLALGREAPAHVVGLTGPPGAGKSTLLSALVRHWREGGRTVAVLAVDPSSKRSGGSLLGDRARIDHDPGDPGVLIRSTAAAGRLGGIAAPTRAGAQALAAAFDLVVVETVGVGQSETEVEDVVDTVVVAVQPGSGDTLQFLKAGIMEVPDVLVVTKADAGPAAARARQDLEAALAALDAAETPVLETSAVAPTRGIAELAAAIDAHGEALDVSGRRMRGRRHAALAEFAAEHGDRGLRALGGRREAERLLAARDPREDVPALVAALEDSRAAAGADR